MCNAGQGKSVKIIICNEIDEKARFANVCISRKFKKRNQNLKETNASTYSEIIYFFWG